MKKCLKAVIVIIIIIWILINVFSIANLSLFGIRVFRIGSGSMEPYLKVNDLVIIKKQKDYNKNDVITYKEDGQYITHRIVEIEGENITTKGDSNNTNDPSFTKDKIVGKEIFKFRILGFLSYLLLKPFSWVLIFFIGVFIIILMPVKKTKGKHSV